MNDYPIRAISPTVRRPLPNTIALGGVATGIMNAHWTLGIVAVAIAACSGGDGDDATRRPVEDSAFAEQVEPLDRARATEALIGDAADARRRELEQQER